jgi:hypothetical protein
MRNLAWMVFVAGVAMSGCGDDGGSNLPPDAALLCEETLDGCNCSEFNSVDELDECSEASVARPGAAAYCCEDSIDCSCHEVLCWMTGPVCSCGNSYIVEDGIGAQVPACGGEFCCLDDDGQGCTCGPLECTASESEVAACGMTDVMTCDLSTAEMVSVCK